MTVSNNVLSLLQSRLSELGYYHLVVDGLDGTGTNNAVINFKADHKLRRTNFVGPITHRLIFDPATKPRPAPKPVEGVPPFLLEAKRLLGVREFAGSRNNPVIMRWAEELDQWYSGDDLAWCGLFAAHCMAYGAPDQPQDFNRLGARAWLNYGKLVLGEGQKFNDLPYGLPCVLWRTDRYRSWNGHIFLITGQNKTHVRGIGGNQGDAVTEAWFPRDRILGVVAPSDYDMSKAPSAPEARTGVISTNEA